MALAHTVGDKVEAAYRRGDLFEKRRQLAEAWAQFCTSPTASGELVQIRPNCCRAEMTPPPVYAAEDFPERDSNPRPHGQVR